MANYIIKNNLPTEHLAKVQGFESKSEAKESFINTYSIFSALHPCKMFIRDERDMVLRGTIQVEIDGFYYYFELYENR